jgi:hypothetical protein
MGGTTLTVDVPVTKKDPQSLTHYAQGTNGMVTGILGESVVIAVFTGLRSAIGNLTWDDGVTCEEKSHPRVPNCVYISGAREVTYVCSVTAQEDRPYRLYHRGTPYDVQLTVVATNTTTPPGPPPTAGLSLEGIVTISVIGAILFLVIVILVIAVAIIALLARFKPEISESQSSIRTFLCSLYNCDSFFYDFSF